MDDIERIIMASHDIAAKIFGKELSSHEFVIFDEIEDSHALYEVLKQLLSVGAICKAEDTLFFEIAKDYSESKFLVGEEFYDILDGMDDDYLLEHNFSREEVASGRADFLKLKK